MQSVLCLTRWGRLKGIYYSISVQYKKLRPAVIKWHNSELMVDADKIGIYHKKLCTSYQAVPMV